MQNSSEIVFKQTSNEEEVSNSMERYSKFFYYVLVINLLQFLHLEAQEPKVVFLPEIQENNFQLLSNPNPNEYRLNLNIPESLRSETIAFKPVTGLNFSGSVSTNYKDVNKNLIVDYVADVNGYRGKFRIEEEQPYVQRGFQVTPVLSVDVLKSGVIINFISKVDHIFLLLHEKVEYDASQDVSLF
uniref:Uncharacterized protein n=1 Tax=Glossina austeni TaxID=7395 RepID=A0A1A9VWL9_GLOAU